jgi:hypothetical protein
MARFSRFLNLNFSSLRSFDGSGSDLIQAAQYPNAQIGWALVLTILLTINILELSALININLALLKNTWLDLSFFTNFEKRAFLLAKSLLRQLLSWLVITLVYKPLCPFSILKRVLCLDLILMVAFELQIRLISILPLIILLVYFDLRVRFCGIPDLLDGSSKSFSILD